MELILKKVQKKHLALIAELAKTLEIEIEAAGSTYNAEFVDKIKRSQEDFKAGRYRSVKTADLWK